MNKVQFLDQTHYLPKTWDEFTPKQMALVAQLLLIGMDHTRFKSLLAIEIMGLRKNIFNFAGLTYFVQNSRSWFKPLAFRYIAHKKAPYIDPEDLYFVAQLFNFMFTTKKIDKSQSVTIRDVYLTKNFFPKIKTSSGMAYGPSDYFGNVVVAEFLAAEMHYEQYMKEPKMEHLNNLCAALYRPCKRFYSFKKFLQTVDSDKRIRFSDDYTMKAGSFSKTPLWVRFAVLILFEGVRNNFRIDFPEIYQEGEASEDAGSGWSGIVATIAENVTRVEDVLYTNIHTFLFDLNQKIIIARRLKSKK
jgi:hypothetical protein